MAEPLRVLIVEDSEDDTLLMVRDLKRGGFDPAFERVETPASMKAALEGSRWDLVISVSGTMGEDIAVAMMKAGADDYVMKDRLGRLVPAIKRELRATEERRVR